MGSSIYYVITDGGGGAPQMITDFIGGSDQIITDYIFVADQAAAFHKILYLYYAIYNFILVNMPNICLLPICRNLRVLLGGRFK